MSQHGKKYEAAAKVAEWQGMESRHVADLLLRAAWCCVDEGDIEAERYFRRKAAWKFDEALGSFDGVAREERAVLTYLVGELWRRVGDTTVATTCAACTIRFVAWIDESRWDTAAYFAVSSCAIAKWPPPGCGFRQRRSRAN